MDEFCRSRTLFPDTGGIVIGEAYRVDRDSVSGVAFRADDARDLGRWRQAPLLCFDGSFGSSHGIVFAGSGGFKTTSVTIPTALKWGGALVVLDPSNEVAPMVMRHRMQRRTRSSSSSIPKYRRSASTRSTGSAGLAATKEEDIAAVASWIMSDSPRQNAVRDDFFRASALQLLTAIIADVCLSGHTEAERPDPASGSCQPVRAGAEALSPSADIYDQSKSTFVKENVAPFINMTPETFCGVYANAAKETHWLSYPNYAALVSGSSFKTDDLAGGNIDSSSTSISRRWRTMRALPASSSARFSTRSTIATAISTDVTLFLLDEVARLGYLRILETARDAGRKYGITLTMLYQSIGQMREAYGGRDATSKWFESASWISFAAVNDPETADYISKRCGTTTVEVDQTSRSSKMSGSSGPVPSSCRRAAYSAA